MGNCNNVDEIKTLLSSKKTTDVRKAAKFLQKNLMPELEDLVIEAFQRESLRNHMMHMRRQIKISTKRQMLLRNPR